MKRPSTLKIYMQLDGLLRLHKEKRKMKTKTTTTTKFNTLSITSTTHAKVVKAAKKAKMTIREYVETKLKKLN